MGILAAICGGCAVFIIAWKSLLIQPTVVERPVPKEKNLLLVLVPVLGVVATLTRGLMWKSFGGWAQRKLDAAGMRAYLTVEELFAAHFVLLAIGWMASSPYPDSFRWLIIGSAIVFPELTIYSLISARHAKIRREMPYFTDMLAMCTGAGLDFGAAIDRVLSRSKDGPLIDEFRTARRDNTLGKSQQDALASMADRVQLPELTSFVAIIVQAMRMGGAVTGILEAQAEKMRIERYEKAERLGTQAQQKIIMPLLLLILPAFVLLGIVPLMFAMARPIFEGGLLSGPGF